MNNTKESSLGYCQVLKTVYLLQNIKETIAEAPIILLVFPLLACIQFLRMMTMPENCVVSEISVL